MILAMAISLYIRALVNVNPALGSVNPAMSNVIPALGTVIPELGNVIFLALDIVIAMLDSNRTGSLDCSLLCLVCMLIL